MSQVTVPSPLATLRAVFIGYLPRVFQARGWILAAMPLAPVGTAILVSILVQAQGGRFSSAEALKVFHEALLKVLLPVMALTAAPAGVREDLEQRTLPLMLVRPAPVWMYPLSKGLVWFAWGALWLLVAAAGLLFLGASTESILRGALALVGLYWAELAFLTLLGLLLKRGTLWGALYIFLFDPLVRILPGNMQRLTFMHYAESIAGSRSSEVGVRELLAQTQLETPMGIALAALFVFGLACWAACGWKLHRTPVGLSGKDAEG
ncbi:MAG: hypothetical protein HY823_00630 [Acidobacteria bacterium]|nr:hypothetical protein [Acidobacteriota bacterium]